MNYRSLFNLGVNIVAAVVFGVLLIISIFAGGVKKKTDAIFSILIGFVLLGCLTNSIFYGAVLGDMDDISTLIALKTTASVILDLAGLLSLLYCVSYFELSNRNKAIAIVLSSIVCLVSIVLKIINQSKGISFVIENHRVVTNDKYWLNYLYVMVILLSCLVMTCVHKDLHKTERVSFIAFYTIPLIASIFHFIFSEYGILIFALCASFLFHYVFYYVERGKIITKQQNELVEQQINVMISQIQPHFIYNCLSSISYLCRTEPRKAELAINDFSNYLRGNLSNLSQTKIVPFKKELEYTQNYLKLEKLRFEDRVKVVYNIRTENFNVPSLSLQPIVENAVKHGVCKKINGGTVTISTWEDSKNNYIKVSDDGVGYDFSAPKQNDDRVHVGLANTTERIEKMCHGKVTVNSKINLGTTVVMTIPKNIEKVKEQNKK